MNKEKAMKIQKTYQIVRYLLLAAILIILGAASAKAQEVATKDYPKGKAIITIFGDAGVGFQDGKKTSLGFNLDRAYLGYQYELNQNWKAKLVYDMGRGDDNSLQRLGYVKNAEIDYKTGNFSLNMGLTSTALFNVQEKFWGLRYVYKSYMDQRKWGSSADLGLIASYKFAKWISADVSIFNGEGYKKIQLDDQLLYGVGLTFKPVEGLTIRAYGDFKTAKDTTCQENIALFAGYQTKAFRIGAEYNMEFNQGNSKGHNLQGVSVYGAGSINSKLEVYGRYDYGKSSADDDWEYGQNGHTGMLGVSWQINKLFAISPNVRLNKTDGNKAAIYACVSGKVNF